MRWRNRNIETDKSEQRGFAPISLSKCYKIFYRLCCEAFQSLQYKVCNIKFDHAIFFPHVYIIVLYLAPLSQVIIIQTELSRY